MIIFRDRKLFQINVFFKIFFFKTILHIIIIMFLQDRVFTENIIFCGGYHRPGTISLIITTSIIGHPQQITMDGDLAGVRGFMGGEVYPVVGGGSVCPCEETDVIHFQRSINLKVLSITIHSVHSENILHLRNQIRLAEAAN